MIKKLIRAILAVLCIASACALDASGGKNTQAANTETMGANTMKITITVNGKTLTASLYDNSSTRALVELLKKGAVTIEMHDYGNFEKVGELPVSLPRNDTPTNTDAGDLILYQGKSFSRIESPARQRERYGGAGGSSALTNGFLCRQFFANTQFY